MCFVSIGDVHAAPISGQPMSGRIASLTRESVRVLTIDAPGRRNALTGAMRDALGDALEAAFLDETCRAIVLTGADNQFCAGFDVADMAGEENTSLADLRFRLERLHRIVRHLAGGAKPVIAAVEGVAAGAGLSFAAACDFVVAGEGASFVASWTKLALVPDCGALWSLPQRVGYGLARDMMFSGRRVALEEASSCGLVDKAVPAGCALEEAVARAASYAAAGPLAIASTKLALSSLRDGDLAAALETEIQMQGPLKLSADHAEARRAFMEKRPAKFIAR